MAKIAWNPQHPERICWGCTLYCAADDLACGNGTIRTPHPVELFGEDWLDWSNRRAGHPKHEMLTDPPVDLAAESRQA